MASGKLREYDPGEPGDSWYAEELDYNYETGKTKDIRKPVGKSNITNSSAYEASIYRAVWRTSFE